MSTCARALLAVGVSAVLVVPSAATSAPRTLIAQAGVIRQVVRDDRWVAWTRCRDRTGPSEVWALRLRPRRLVRVRGLRSRLPCEPHRLHGIWRGRLVVTAPGPGGRARLLVVALPSGRAAELDVSDPGAGGRLLVGADASAYRVAWVREVGPPEDRSAEVAVHDLRSGAEAVVLRRTAFGDAVRLIGVWVNTRGDVAVHERLRGALYGYGTGQERVRLLPRRGRGRTLARVPDLVHVAGGDLGGAWFVFSLAHENVNRVWVYGWDLVAGRRRLLRVVRAAAWPGGRMAPGVAAPRLFGDMAVWRERRVVGRRVLEEVRARRIGGRGRALVGRAADGRRGRLFVGPPLLRRQLALWPEVRFRAAAGNSGGYLGLSRRPARSRLQFARVSPRRAT